MALTEFVTFEIDMNRMFGQLKSCKIVKKCIIELLDIFIPKYEPQALFVILLH